MAETDELTGVVDRAVKQLAIALGEDQARSLVTECLAGHGITSPSTMEHLVVLASCLAKHGGFAEVVGRSLRHHALQRGYSPRD